MRSILIFLIVVGFLRTTSYAFGQEENIERIILVAPSDCLILNKHVPDADVKYQPDVDVRGNSTVPAEIENSDVLGLDDKGYSFYMVHDALKDNEIAAARGLSDAEEGKIILGSITVKNGDILWNGSSLKAADRDRIYMLCEEDRRQKRRPIYKR